jgi:hypothetical protein
MNGAGSATGAGSAVVAELAVVAESAFVAELAVDAAMRAITRTAHTRVAAWNAREFIRACAREF